MNEKPVQVGIAEGKVVVKPGKLISHALGSCVGICLYDGKTGVAGMVHILLPERSAAIRQENPYKFADSGVETLVCMMEETGAERKRMTAKIAGGAKMFAANGLAETVGERNIKAARDVLTRLRIPVVAEDTGKDYGRTICFDSGNGKLEVRSAKNHKTQI